MIVYVCWLQNARDFLFCNIFKSHERFLDLFRFNKAFILRIKHPESHDKVGLIIWLFVILQGFNKVRED